MNTIVISNEDDLLDLLSNIQNDQLSTEELDVKFENWPVFTMRLEGEGYHSTITPSLMKGFLEMQAAIYRSYAIARYNSPKITHLSAQEKKQLELQVKVLEGSSLFQVDFQQIIEKLSGDLVGKMESKHLMYLILGVAVIYGGHSTYNAHLEQRKEIRLAEVKSEEQRLALEQLRFSDEQETKRMEMLTDVIKESPRLKTIQQYHGDATTELLKRSGSANVVEIQGVSLTGEDAIALTKNARKVSEEAYLDGSYRILGVDSSKPGVFKVKIRSLDTGEVFTTIASEKTLLDKHFDIIQDAEWKQQPVRLHINARMAEGEIKSATITRAEVIEIKES